MTRIFIDLMKGDRLGITIKVYTAHKTDGPMGLAKFNSEGLTTVNWLSSVLSDNSIEQYPKELKGH